MTLRCLFVDFNSYFASVEQYDEPGLLGRPVAVVPVMSATTCAIAASYEAKAFGVKTGTRCGKRWSCAPTSCCARRAPLVTSRCTTG